MKAPGVMLAGLACLWLLAGCGPKQTETMAVKAPALTQAVGGGVAGAAPREAESKPVNRKCPVMKGQPVNSKLTVEYKGKTYAVCCKECLSRFKANPAKYAKIADAEGKQ